MNFTIVINNRNRLTTTKKMVNDLLNRGSSNIIIIDNDSNYQPLLNWYESISDSIKIHRGRNYGHYALFQSGILDQINDDWCFYTDSDIELNPNMPDNYQQIMLDLAIKYNYNKIGLALQIDNIPDHYMFKDQVLRNEHPWWQKKVIDNVYQADTDTTFCLIKKCDQFNSLRIAGDFTCMHTPWYLDLYNLSEEEQFYHDNLGDRALTQYSKQHKLRKEL
jgi:hypothetical protein